MSTQTWWIVMSGWALIAVGMMGWIWYQVGKADKELAAQMDLDYDLLMEVVADEIVAQRTMKREAAKPITAAAFQERARRAESLGFMDDDPPRVA